MHENQQPQTEAFELSAAEREAIEHEMHHYEDPRAASIEALKIVQKQRGIKDGQVFNELHRGTDTRKDFFAKILEVVSVLGGEQNDLI